MHHAKLDPDRPVNWRYLIASHLVDSGRHIRGCDGDELTSVVYRCLLHRRRGGDALRPRYPHLSRAMGIYGDPRSSTRYHLEARLVTGAPVSAIASQVGVAPGTVRWYAAVFFDVGDRLARPDYMVDLVVGWGIHSARDWRDTLWKTAAYFGGPVMLDTLMCVAGAGGLSGLDSSLELQRRLSVQQSQFASLRHAGPGLIRRLRDVQRLEIERRRDPSHDPNTCEACQALQALLESIPFSTLGCTKIAALPKEMKYAADLRSDELMWMAMGQALSYLDLLRDTKFPEPPAPGSPWRPVPSEAE